MFLSGGLRPPAFAAVDHDLGFPPPQAPDLASAFLAALDAIDDRRFVTPVPDEPLRRRAPIVPPGAARGVQRRPWSRSAAGEPVYELRPQSRLELESEETSEAVDETPAEPVARRRRRRGAAAVGPAPSAPVAGLAPAAAHATESADDTWAFASYLESESDLQARAATTAALEGANAPSAARSRGRC